MKTEEARLTSADPSSSDSKRSAGRALVLPSHPHLHEQAHTFPTAPRHRAPGAPAWLRSILTSGCQMTEESVFELTEREGRPCCFRQVMLTISGCSLVFSTLRLAPREHVKAVFEKGLILQAPPYPGTLQACTSQL